MPAVRNRRRRHGFLTHCRFEELDRQKTKPGRQGVATPVSDIAMIFFNDAAPMTDVNVRKAAVVAVDKQAIVDRLLRGYGVPIETLLAPP